MTTPPDDHPSVPNCLCATCGVCYHDHGGYHHQWERRPIPHMASVRALLVDTGAALVHCGRDARTLYRWAQEGRLTRHGGRGKGNARWDLRELPPWDGEGTPPPPPAKLWEKKLSA